MTTDGLPQAPRRRARRTVVELAGGVGGAKLGHGLQSLVTDRLVVVVNTGDDLELHGLLVCPDHDTVMYTLAGLDNRTWGWGIEGETFTAAEWLARYGEQTWFRLGDRDLATHIVRTARMRAGERLTDVNRHLQRSLGVGPAVLPMTDAPVRTQVRTPDGWLAFQDYFVRRHQEPDVLEVRFDGATDAAVTPEILGALETADAIVIAPSNPIVSVGPILAVGGMRAALDGARRRGVPAVGVSPIVGGRAIKGPADRMLATLGHEPTALGVARLYVGLLDGFVLDRQDAELRQDVEALGMAAHVCDTMMIDDASRARLGAEVIGFAGELRSRVAAPDAAARPATSVG